MTQKSFRLLFSIYLFLFPMIVFGEITPSEQIKETKQVEKNENKQPKEDISKQKDDARSGQKEEEKEEPPKIGNFALPTSQQPYGLFAFGGNIIDKGEVQIFLFADEFVGKRRLLTDLIPSVLFGVTDDFSIQLNFPIAPINIDQCDRSSGFEDFFIQFEYAFWNKQTYTHQDQATILASIYAPTGSFNKRPPTGFGGPSLFIAATYIHMCVDWFVFVNEGAVLTTSNHHRKAGDQFLYQFGFGRNIPSPCDWIYAWMIEIDGQYLKKNEFHGKFDNNSGGNAIFVTPSLWLSNKDFLLQFGVSFPIHQNLFGNQRKFDYALNFNCGWSFY